MILLLDIGNTNLKWVLVSQSKEFVLDGVLYHRDLTMQKLELHLLGVWKEVRTVTDVVVANVGKEVLSHQVEKVVMQLWQARVEHIYVAEQAGGVKNTYQAISQLGVDRWLAVIGARQSCTDAGIVVVDAGTAINIELLLGDEYQGGVILPGFRLMHDSLVGNAHGVHSDMMAVPQIIGKSTAECVNSGVYFGLAGAVDRVVDELKQLAQVPLCVILCGGDAHQLSGLLKSDALIDMNLIFKGLLRVAKCVH